MTKLEEAREKAKNKLTEEVFEQLDKFINGIGVTGTKKAEIWNEFLNGKMVQNEWIEPSDITEEEIAKVDEDIKSRGNQAILDILDKQMMIPKNLRLHLRKKYSKELSEVKEIIHKRRYSDV